MKWLSYAWCAIAHRHSGTIELEHTHGPECKGEDVWAEGGDFGYIWWCRGCKCAIRITMLDRRCWAIVPKEEVEWLRGAMTLMEAAP